VEFNRLKYSIIFIFLAFILFSKPILAIDNSEIANLCDSLLGNRKGAIIVAKPYLAQIICAVGDSDIVSGAEKYPPGSVFKIVSSLAALEKKIDPKNTVRCTYYYPIARGKVLHCSWKPGHGIVDMRRALSLSCSFYFYNLMDNGLAADDIKEMAKILGFDESPYDNISCSTIKKFDTKSFKYRFAVGLTGIYTTPYHLLRMIGTVANAGLMPNFDDNSLTKIADIPDENWQVVRDGLKSSVSEGLCHFAFDNKISAAGKTGTATIPENPDRTCGWFIGYYPADGIPNWAVVVLIVDGTGFTDSAPIGAKILNHLKNTRRCATMEPSVLFEPSALFNGR